MDRTGSFARCHLAGDTLYIKVIRTWLHEPVSTQDCNCDNYNYNIIALAGPRALEVIIIIIIQCAAHAAYTLGGIRPEPAVSGGPGQAFMHGGPLHWYLRPCVLSLKPGYPTPGFVSSHLHAFNRMQWMAMIAFSISKSTRWRRTGPAAGVAEAQQRGIGGISKHVVELP
jgi:hypothetical protein